VKKPILKRFTPETAAHGHGAENRRSRTFESLLIDVEISAAAGALCLATNRAFSLCVWMHWRSERFRMHQAGRVF
jgi:hypothetical protein